jgi:hypothetical protein
VGYRSVDATQGPISLIFVKDQIDNGREVDINTNVPVNFVRIP